MMNIKSRYIKLLSTEIVADMSAGNACTDCHVARHDMQEIRNEQLQLITVIHGLTHYLFTKVTLKMQMLEI